MEELTKELFTINDEMGAVLACFRKHLLDVRYDVGAVCRWKLSLGTFSLFRLTLMSPGLESRGVAQQAVSLH